MTLASVFGTWRAQALNPLTACRQLLNYPTSLNCYAAIYTIDIPADIPATLTAVSPITRFLMTPGDVPYGRDYWPRSQEDSGVRS